MAAACFVLGCALFIAPLWDYADTMSTLRLLSWFGIGAGALSVIGAFASTAPFTLRGAEPAVGALLLVSGLWTLNFPAAAGALKISLFATCAFMALYILCLLYTSALYTPPVTPPESSAPEVAGPTVWGEAPKVWRVRGVKS